MHGTKLKLEFLNKICKLHIYFAEAYEEWMAKCKEELIKYWKIYKK